MTIRFSVEGALGTLTVDRVQKLNALDLECFQAIEAIVGQVQSDQGIRGLVVLAEGTRAFSAGADINDLRGLDAAESSRRATYRRMVLQSLAELPIPSVAVIEAPAMGGGVELALACTFRVASPAAKFSFPEIRLGLLPGAGGTQRLPRLVGASRALDMMLTARVIDATEALRIGLVDRVAVDARGEALVLAGQWLQYSRAAAAGIMAAVDEASLPMREGLAAEGRHLAAVSASADAAEGVAAFLEKRAARFNQP
jgi:enoyl-CoA hydratase